MKIQMDWSWTITQTTTQVGDIWEDGRISLVLKEYQCECPTMAFLSHVCRHLCMLCQPPRLVCDHHLTLAVVLI